MMNAYLNYGDPMVLKALATRAGGESVDGQSY